MHSLSHFDYFRFYEECQLHLKETLFSNLKTNIIKNISEIIANFEIDKNINAH